MIEITRRCNMSCRHCIRGDAQNKDIDLEYIDIFLSKLRNKFIGTVTFTGGEPTLNPEAIRYTIDKLSEYNINYQRIGIISNGKGISDECIELFNSSNKILVEISQDEYHEPLTEKDYAQLSKINKVLSRDIDAEPERIIDGGKAKENNIGVLSYNRPFLPYKYNNYLILYILCLSSSGDILYTCGYSFDDLDCFRICNVEDNIIKRIFDKSLNHYICDIYEAKNDVSKEFFDYIYKLKKQGYEL